MIRHEKRKNSDKTHFPYVNFLIVTLIIGAFAAFNFGQSAESSEVINEAQISSYAFESVDVSGEWVGTMTEDYDSEVRYDYRIVLSQDNDNLSGTAYQESTNMVNDIEIYSESTLVGDVSNDVIYFYEASTDVLENVSLDRWCRIEVSLNYEVIDGQETLIGTWDGVQDNRLGCDTIDGRVLLTRQPE